MIGGSVFDGVSASTLDGNFTQMVFDFKPSWALRAARLPIVQGLYAS